MQSSSKAKKLKVNMTNGNEMTLVMIKTHFPVLTSDNFGILLSVLMLV